MPVGLSPIAKEMIASQEEEAAAGAEKVSFLEHDMVCVSMKPELPLRLVLPGSIRKCLKFPRTRLKIGPESLYDRTLPRS